MAHPDDSFFSRPISAGIQHAKDTHAERKALEAALKYYAEDDADWPAVRYPHMAALREAARKHLDTLPKPEPEWRVVGIRLGCRETCNYKFLVRTNAIGVAADWMATGKYSSVAVEQVS